MENIENRISKIEQNQIQVERTLQNLIKELQKTRISPPRPLPNLQVSAGQRGDRSIVGEVLGKKRPKIGQGPSWLDRKRVKEKEREKAKRQRQEKERKKERERKKQKKEKEMEKQRSLIGKE